MTNQIKGESFAVKQALMGVVETLQSEIHFEEWAPLMYENGTVIGRQSTWASEQFTSAHRATTWAFHNAQTDIWRLPADRLLTKLSNLAIEFDRDVNRLAMEVHYA